MAVDYPDLSSLNNNSGIGGFLSLPNASYPYFWAWILIAVWAIMTFSFYYADKAKGGRGQILSAMAISAFAVIFLSVIGTMTGIIENFIMVYVLVIGIIIMAIWWVSVQ